MTLYLLEGDGRPSNEMVDHHDLDPPARRRSTGQLLGFKVYVYSDPVQLEPGTDLTH